MTLSKKEDLEKKGLKLLDNQDNKRGNEIFLELFLKWNTLWEVSEKIYPHLYNNKDSRIKLYREKKGIKQVWRKGKINRVVSSYIYAFNKLGWLERRERKQNTPGKDPFEYRAKLEPYFHYLKDIRDIELSSKEKNQIRLMSNKCRDLIFWFDLDFLKSMDKFVEVMIFDFLDINSSHFKEFFVIGRELAVKFCDEITLKLLGDKLENQFYAKGHEFDENFQEEIIETFILFLQDPNDLISDVITRINANKDLLVELKKKGEQSTNSMR